MSVLAGGNGENQFSFISNENGEENHFTQRRKEAKA
jgi:hypothetical protein